MLSTTGWVLITQKNFTICSVFTVQWMRYNLCMNASIFVDCLKLICDKISLFCHLCFRDIWLTHIFHIQPDQLPVRQRLLCVGFWLSPPGVPAVQWHQTTSFWRPTFLTGKHCASVLRQPLPFSLSKAPQPGFRPRGPPLSLPYF